MAPTITRNSKYESGDKELSIDGKVIYTGATVCSVVGLVLLVVGAVVYYENSEDGEQLCACPDGESGEECCQEISSVCDECWCTSTLSEGYCADFEDSGSHGGAGLSLAIAGLVVCVFSSAMLCTMKACKNWSEKHLHKNPPANLIV